MAVVSSYREMFG